MFEEFVKSHARNGHVTAPGLQIYVRRSVLPNHGDFELARIVAEEPGKGALTRFLDRWEPEYSLYIENVLTERLAKYLVRRGYQCTRSIPPCFLKVKIDSEAILHALKAIKTRIEDPQCWTRDEWAKDRAGNGTSWGNKLAIAWCLRGALFKETEKSTDNDLRRAVEAQILKFAKNYAGTAELNDTTNHRFVLSTLDKAIEDLKGRA